MGKKIVGYVRVSGIEQVESAQEIEQQAERLEAQGATEIFVDIGSGMSEDRSEFSSMMALVCAGEVQEVVVTRLDRLTRSIAQLGQFVEMFENSDVNLRVLDQPLGSRTPPDTLMMRLLGITAEWEGDLSNQKSEESS